MIEYVRVNPTDYVQRGARFRLTYTRGNAIARAANVLNPFSSSSYVKVYETLGQYAPVFPISPKPADADQVAVIDVKVSTSAPTMSVGQLADALNDVTDATYLARIEAIDNTALSTTVASAQRTAVATDAARQLAASNPLNVFGDVLGAVKLLAIVALVGAGVYLFVTYGPKPKRRGR